MDKKQALMAYLNSRDEKEFIEILIDFGLLHKEKLKHYIKDVEYLSDVRLE